MKLICLIFGHKWGKWDHIKTLDELGYPDVLLRKCKICGKKEEYIGFTKICINGEKSPRIC